MRVSGRGHVLVGYWAICTPAVASHAVASRCPNVGLQLLQAAAKALTTTTTATTPAQLRTSRSAPPAAPRTPRPPSPPAGLTAALGGGG